MGQLLVRGVQEERLKDWGQGGLGESMWLDTQAGAQSVKISVSHISIHQLLSQKRQQTAKWTKRPGQFTAASLSHSSASTGK